MQPQHTGHELMLPQCPAIQYPSSEVGSQMKRVEIHGLFVLYIHPVHFENHRFSLFNQENQSADTYNSDLIKRAL